MTSKIYYTTYGYDATYVAFFKIIKETAKTVTFVEIGQEWEHLDGFHNNITSTPSNKELDDTFRTHKKTMRHPMFGRIRPYEGSPISINPNH